MLSVPFNLFDVFLESASGAHDLMSTTKAAQTEISSNAQNFPSYFAAGMWLLHRENITHSNVHAITP